MAQRKNEKKFINGLRKIRQQLDEKHDLKEIMENNFNEFERKIKQTVKEEIIKNSKLIIKDNLNTTQNEYNKTKEKNKTFASVVKSNKENTLLPQFHKLLHDEKIKWIEEEKQKDVRKSNIIIYGKEECEESIYR